ncbi:hypothetical protein Tco_1407249 [Tanacetum coccineum]
MLTDQVDLVNPEGHRLVPDYLVLGDKGRRSALSISKLKAAQYLNFGLEELVPSLWIESEREYDINDAYGISYRWFKRKEFYITRHSAPSDRSKVRSHIRILSVVSLKTYERYMYPFLKEIVLRRADYKEYKISEADFKNLHSNDFEDLILDKLDHMVKDFKLYEYNKGMETQIWFEDDRRRSKDFIEVHIKMEMVSSCSGRDKFITACSYLTNTFKDFMKAQIEGPYYTDISTPDEIHQFLRFERVESNRTIKSKFVTLTPNQVLTKEVREDLKHWEELIPEQQYNLAYFFIRRIDSAKATPKAHLSYGMFLTRLLQYVMEHYPLLNNDIYNVVDRVMRPLALRQTRKPRSDHGVQKDRHSISSSSTHHFGSSSHQEDDDNDDGTSRASTPSPNSFLNSLSPLAHQKYNIPSSSQQSNVTNT